MTPKATPAGNKFGAYAGDAVNRRSRRAATMPAGGSRRVA
jgi:hypothetical protein